MCIVYFMCVESSEKREDMPELFTTIEAHNFPKGKESRQITQTQARTHECTHTETETETETETLTEPKTETETETETHVQSPQNTKKNV